MYIYIYVIIYDLDDYDRGYVVGDLHTYIYIYITCDMYLYVVSIFCIYILFTQQPIKTQLGMPSCCPFAL